MNIDLNAIKARHASDEETGEADAADTHEDRGLLLILVERLTRAWETQDTYENPMCFFCCASIAYTSPTWEEVEAGAKSEKVCDHAADCPVPHVF